MKKVGILSMQRIANYGSFLQAYALKHILVELGCEVQFVDYHIGECLVCTSEATGILRKIKKMLEVFQCNATLKEKAHFIKYKKNYATKYYPYLGIKKNEMNYTPELDNLIIGSDEVFNCVQSNTNVGFSPELFGVNNNAKKLISYAASFGNTTIDSLKQYGVEEKVAEWLKKFDALSVRDENSGVIVKRLIDITPEYNLDPVIAYDLIGKCKDIPQTVPDSNYLILYGYSGRFAKDECKIIRTYAKKRKLKIICIGGIQNCCDKFIDCNPFEVLAYFQHADCIITDTFHGTIMSVITHRQFVSLVRKSGYGNSEKMTDLLKRLKLSHRVITNMNVLHSMIEKKIDYTVTDMVIKKEREHTKNYLEKQLFE